MTATPNLPFKAVESRFKTRTRDVYTAMGKRLAERKSAKTGRLLQVGRQVPFSLDDFRDWLVLKLGGEGGVVKCRYCAEWLTIDNLVIDHADPISQGGSLCLDNLDLLCKFDNDAKSAMTAKSYQALLDWSLTGMAPACRQNMLHRLSIAVSLAAKQRWDMAKKHRQQKVNDEQF